MKLIFIRHGSTEANEKRLYCGSTDIWLSEKGVSELKTLKKEVDYPDISNFRVITSGMKRCEETLETLYGELEHETLPALAEMDFGAFEMYSYEQLKNVPEYVEWISGDNEANVAPDGESGEIMKNRVFDCIDAIINDGRDSVIFTHGGVIAAVMDKFFKSEQKNRYQWQPKPGRGYFIDFSKNYYAEF